MNEINSKLLLELLSSQANLLPIRQLIDYIHALTVFCKVTTDRQISTNKRTWEPNYQNRFNQSKMKLDGIIVGNFYICRFAIISYHWYLGAMFDSVILKLLQTKNEFCENSVIIYNLKSIFCSV